MPHSSYPRYERTDSGSLAFYFGEGDLSPMRVTETLGIVYDAGDGIMQKHGEAERVRPAFTRIRQALTAASIDPSGLRLVETR